MVDISEIKPIERTVELTKPGTDGVPLGIRVTVMSINDDRLKKQKLAIRSEANRLASKGKYIKGEQEEQNSVDLLWAATTGWEWYNPTGEEGDAGYDADEMPNWNGEVLEYNQKNFKEFIKRGPWWVTQLVAEIDEEKAFFTN